MRSGAFANVLLQMGEHATPTLEALLTPAEVCATLRISLSTFYRLVQGGQLEGVQLGGRDGASWRVRVADLERFLATTTDKEA